MKRFPQSKITEAVAAARTVREAWLSHPNVTALDVGYRVHDGELQDELAIRVHVRRKQSVETLAEEDVINDRARPRMVEGFPIDVMTAEYEPQANGTAQSGPLLKAREVDRRARFTPVVGGISIGNPRATAGTLGAIVRDRVTGEPLILGNHHVLAGSRSARAGEIILQPGPIDGGRDGDEIARLTRMRFDRRADAAVARLEHGDHAAFSEWLLDVPQRLVGTMPADRWPLGVEVVKSGRTTGVTEGVVDGVALFVRLAFSSELGGTRWLREQVHIARRPNAAARLSEGGDSGSVWLESNSGRAVSLHVGGSTMASPIPYALGTPMAPLSAWLGFSFEPLFHQPHQRTVLHLGSLGTQIPAASSYNAPPASHCMPAPCGCGGATLMVGNGAMVWPGHAQPVAEEIGGSG